MIVCICHHISDREISKHANAGMSFDDIQFETGLSTQCGKCEGCARDVVAQCGAKGKIAYLRQEGVRSSSVTFASSAAA
jgi:bacterioferritin-associated ferredoxin